jgi:hypothetical protein
MPSVQNQLGDIVVMDLAIIMLVAAVMIAIAFKLKQPMVIGYIPEYIAKKSCSQITKYYCRQQHYDIS